MGAASIVRKSAMIDANTLLEFLDRSGYAFRKYHTHGRAQWAITIPGTSRHRVIHDEVVSGLLSQGLIVKRKRGDGREILERSRL
jgi:hypothetical protein